MRFGGEGVAHAACEHTTSQRERHHKDSSSCCACRQNILPCNKKASRIERGVSPHSLARRVSASTSSGRFPDFQPITRAPAKKKSALLWRPITVAGPWPIFTAFPKN